ncbi:D-alanyl-D-alanine carboxypeptidase/D-alanyl-D-alanine endopeptidase [Schinkia azotoformans]|uniref:D-alanyl-D-alanine carboxypeptidase/D-alanyl-D-alanine endopeptidase n=1 Tax=Schinkia azotoformans TaxID=1454 RepID=UPI002DBA27D1|nr:D-alanyl-D-alanine carboxypeptidase/D-alanyl-D-alanine-endopeptidase [Schinkia azotoformans]MEC1721701.1 D-alanyl-D-alanine carboxypeptidase/D-alanyl-D-alanine-endopeptidase [Schinkia azotoformans]MED4415034.1 D-alanyl-D-alanine carboxypeptidase/D-alanyl-D-alanine-endopeptidase [Schinkia azotoformans]
MKILKKRLHILVILILVAFFLSYSNSKANDLEQTMNAELDQFLQHEPTLKGGLVGISIRSANTGEIIFEHNGDTRMRPASNMKNLTAATALSALGEGYRFKTEVRTKGKRDGSTLKGNLYLKGYGDPTLLIEDLTQLAKKVASSGITVIDGDLIADDSWYDDVRLPPDLVWSDEYAYYGSQVSALTISPNKEYDSGTIQVKVTPGKRIGESAQILLSPKTNYVKVINQTMTIAPDGKTELSIDREHGTNMIIVKGFIPIGAKTKKEWIAVWEPTHFVLDLFQQELKKQGIKLMGDYRVGETPHDADVLTSHQSIPLSELLVPFMKLSNNGHAEVLVKEMGKVKKGEGSWEKGVEVLYEELPNLGVNPKNLVIRDGSGISHVNLVPANEISMLLFHTQQQKWFPAFLDSLPVAGISDKMVGGTLRKRMQTLNVKAKTGTITTVSSLSGYVETKKGETLIFSILINNLLEDDNGKVIEDKIVEIIANY